MGLRDVAGALLFGVLSQRRNKGYSPMQPRSEDILKSFSANLQDEEY
jgi:hypothetical protein